MTPHDPIGNVLGQRLRAARESRGLGIRELAGLSGVSASSISQIERGNTSPKVATLSALARALGLTVAHLLADDRALHEPSRRGDRPALDVRPGLREYLITRRPMSSLEVWAVVLQPGAASEEEQITHGRADEFCLLIRGDQVTFESNKERHALNVGDAIEFRSSTPHRVLNSGRAEAELLWAMTPPTPGPRPRSHTSQ